VHLKHFSLALHQDRNLAISRESSELCALYLRQHKLNQNIKFIFIHWKKFWKSIEGHRMEIVWTFIGNRMDFDYPWYRVLARILDLGRVSNDQGVHMSITLNSKITVLVTLANNNACGCSMLCNQIQGEHTLILRTDIKILSYFSNSWGYLKPF
jgi:hypothetical protein